MGRICPFFFALVLAAWPLGAAELTGFESVTVSGNGQVAAQLAKPAGSGKHPAVILVHDEKGLGPQVREAGLKLAAQGYVVLAPDFGSDPARLAAIPWKQAVADLRAAFAWLAARKDVNGKIGALGFGWGGTMVNNLALAEPKMGAVAAYYGLQPIYYQEDDYRAIGAAILQHYAGRDIMTNQGIDTLVYELGVVGKSMESYLYPRADRGFDDAAATIYDPIAADLAWRRTLAFFKKHLG